MYRVVLDTNVFISGGTISAGTPLVTGNTKDFPFKEYKGVQIVTPKEFLDLLE